MILGHKSPPIFISCFFIFITFALMGSASDDPIHTDQNFNSQTLNEAFTGSWEGEFHTANRPIFITLHLDHNKVEDEWSGSIMALGQTFPLQEVLPDGNILKAVVIPGKSGFSLNISLEDNKLTGTVKDGDEQYPIELKPVPEYPEPNDRNEEWRQDLKALTDRFLQYDYSFTPAEEDLFIEKIEALDVQIPELNDSEIITQMASAVALSNNAHTRLYLLRNRTELRRLPVRLWWFSDGLYVVSTKPSHKNLLGCRVDAIEGNPIHHVRDIVSTAFAGNPSWADYKSVYYMTSPDILHGFGIASDPEKINFSFSECNDNSFNYFISPLPLIRTTNPIEAWWDLSPSDSKDEWIQVLGYSDVSVPLYLRHPNRHYWFEYIEEDSLLYFQYNRASEMKEQDLSSFSEILLMELEKKAVNTFVVDLRFNTGGSLGLAEDLMSELQQRTKNMSRYVITGRATFSAGIAHVASWMEDGNVTLVGEPVGDVLDYWSEGGNIILPNSGLAAHFANAFHSYSEKPCPENVPCYLDLNSPDLHPDISVNTTWKEYANGIDMALDTIKTIEK